MGKEGKGLMGKGYIWENACGLRKLVYEITERFPTKEMRRVSSIIFLSRKVPLVNSLAMLMIVLKTIL